MSVRGDFVKLTAMRKHIEQLKKMGPEVARRASPRLASKFVSAAPSGSSVELTLAIPTTKFLPTGGSLPGKWRDGIEDAAREEFEAITGGS